MSNQNFSSWFRRAMEQKGQGYREAAEEMHIRVTTCWRWANGKSLPGVRHLRPLAFYGGLPVDSLVQLICPTEGTGR